MEDQDARTPKRRRRTVVGIATATGAAIAVAVLTGVAGADPTGSSATSTVYACVGQHDGSVRIVTAATSCRHDEYATSWNTTGPAGAAGPQGPAGAAAPDTTPRARVVGHMTLTPASGDPVTFDVYDYSAQQTSSTTIGSQTGGAGAGKVTFQPITVSKRVDASSPQLFTWLAGNTSIKSAEVQLLGSNGSVAETVDFTLVVLSSLTTSNNGAATDQLHEQLTMLVGAIKVQVGSSTGGGDQVGNTGN